MRAVYGMRATVVLKPDVCFLCSLGCVVGWSVAATHWILGRTSHRGGANLFMVPEPSYENDTACVS
jgi:hypothetical protein